MKRLRIISFIILLAGIASVGYLRVRHGQSSDGIAPSITMDEKKITISVKDEEDVLLQGITAKDNKDGDVTDTLVVDNISTFNGEGKRYVTIAAFDTSNNVGKVTREVEYSDYRAPHFDVTAPFVFSKNENRFLDNITANDVIDGDLTGGIHFADNTSIYSDTPGEYEAKIQVKNSAGDTATLPITLKIVESLYDEKPSVILKHYVRYIQKGQKIDYKKLMDGAVIHGREYELKGGEEVDDKTVGRDLIRINDEDVNYDKAGIYHVTYKIRVPDGQEDTITGTTQLTVIVED